MPRWILLLLAIRQAVGSSAHDLTEHDRWLTHTPGWTWPLDLSGANSSTRDEAETVRRARAHTVDAARLVAGSAKRDVVRDVSRALRVGGWVCYATLIERYSLRWRLADFVPAESARALVEWCGDGAVARPAHLGTVLARQHNGLGNQMWSYAFGRALAESLGFRHAPSKLRFDEQPKGASSRRRDELPPNTDVGFAAFASAFGDGGVARVPEPLLCDRNARWDARLVLSDRAGDPQSLAKRLQRLVNNTFAPPPCVTTLGYFQNYAFLQPIKRRVKAWLDPARGIGRAPAAPGARDVVVHVRWCDARDDARLYDRLLPALEPYEALWAVMPAHCEAGGTYRALAGRHRARMYAVHESCRATSPDDATRAECALADMRFLLGARRIVLAERSTFSFWCAWLSNATEIHVALSPQPQERRAQVVFDEERYVYHDARRGKFFGRVRGDTIQFDGARSLSAIRHTLP